MNRIDIQFFNTPYGELVGYAGGLKAKEKLLALECELFGLV